MISDENKGAKQKFPLLLVRNDNTRHTLQVSQGLQSGCGIADRLSAQSQSKQELQLLWKVPVCLNHTSVGCTVYSAPPVRHLASVNMPLTKATSTTGQSVPHWLYLLCLRRAFVLDTRTALALSPHPAPVQPPQHRMPTETSAWNPGLSAALIKR